MSQSIRDDRIFPITRIALAAANLALVLAFLLLYLFPEATGSYFAWQVQPTLTAVFMGAGYLSGAFMFLFAIFGQKWHRAKNSLLPVFVFAAMTLLATLLHYGRFPRDSMGFKLWLIIHVVTFFLIPWLWFHNRVTDPDTLDPHDRKVPMVVRRLVGLAGFISMIFWLACFIFPNVLIDLWPWDLTPLTARILCTWGVLVSVGGIVMFREPRWTGWRYNILAILLWQALMVVGSLLHQGDFHNGSLWNGYFLGIIAILVVLGGLTIWMEATLPRKAAEPSS